MTVDKTKLLLVKAGDEVTRVLAGVLKMPMKVSEVTKNEILTAGGWKFNRDTGLEIDEDLGWDGITTTGSYLQL